MPQKVTVKLVKFDGWDDELEYDEEVKKLLKEKEYWDELVFFDTKKECEDDYNNSLYYILEYLNDVANKTKMLALKFENSFIKSDYLTKKLRRN